MITPSNIQNKNVLIRADLDVPVKDGQVENDFRLEALLPTLDMCLKYARRVCLIGHMGRPEGVDRAFSLAPVQDWLKRRLNREIPLITSGFSPGECWEGESPLAIMENLRFDKREESLDREFATQLSKGADIYIYEAFATYNPCTSLQTIPEVIHTITGLQFDKEVATLSQAVKNPKHPTLLIASGAKLDKLKTINKISSKFDQVILGGKFAKPEDLTPDGFDLNPEAIAAVLEAVTKANTVVLNGPLGVYEDGIHDQATKAVLNGLRSSKAVTILGGGDTLAAISKLGFSYDSFGFVSTGGGAMLEFLDTLTHPLLEVLPFSPKN